ncbi:MAG: hypothetical protein GX438_11105 [Treponema sp.]|nr:hypothetical protein [Treponema sp.]
MSEDNARDWLGTVQYGSFLPSGDADRELGTFSKSSSIDKDYYYIEVKYSF